MTKLTPTHPLKGTVNWNNYSLGNKVHKHRMMMFVGRGKGKVRHKLSSSNNSLLEKKTGIKILLSGWLRLRVYLSLRFTNGAGTRRRRSKPMTKILPSRKLWYSKTLVVTRFPETITECSKRRTSLIRVRPKRLTKGWFSIEFNFSILINSPYH